MKRKTADNIDTVLNNSSNLKDLSQTFAILDELNYILHKFLPQNLKSHCHIGAIDTKENYVIMYVDDPAIQHLIYNLANPILANFNKYHFSFDGVITKVSQQKKIDNNIRYKKLDDKFKNKLQEIANSINKPEIVGENQTPPDEKEIDL